MGYFLPLAEGRTSDLNSWNQSDIDAAIAANPDLAKAQQRKGDSGLGKGIIPAKPAKATGVRGQAQNKYHVANKEDRTYNNRVYASKKEATKAQELDLRVKAGDIDFYLEQVPFKLPGKTKHLVDFVTFRKDLKVMNSAKTFFLFEVCFIETKGRDLELGKIKRRQTEELFGITITVV